MSELKAFHGLINAVLASGVIACFQPLAQAEDIDRSVKVKIDAYFKEHATKIHKLGDMLREFDVAGKSPGGDFFASKFKDLKDQPVPMTSLSEGNWLFSSGSRILQFTVLGQDKENLDLVFLVNQKKLLVHSGDSPEVVLQNVHALLPKLAAFRTFILTRFLFEDALSKDPDPQEVARRERPKEGSAGYAAALAAWVAKWGPTVMGGVPPGTYTQPPARTAPSRRERSAPE